MVSASDPLPVSATIDTTGLATDATDTNTATIAGDTTSIDAKIPALGQALASASVPVILPSATITTLTPPAAITGFATSAKQDTIIGHVDGIETLLGTIDTDTGNIATEVAGLLTNTELRATPVPVSGTVTAELSAVDNAVLDTIAAKDFATQTTLAAMNAKMVTGTDIGDVTINNASGASAVNIQDGGNTITVDGAVTATLAAETTKVIGTVNIAAAQTLATVTTVGAVTAITNALPAGTNAIGKLSANSGVDIGDVDVTSVSGTVTTKGIPSDIDINGSNANHVDKYYTSTGAATDGIIWSPDAGKRWHVLNLTINVSAACTVTIEDDLAAGDNPRLKFEFAANSGITIPYNKEHPFSSGEDAADLLITTTAGNVYVQAVGYEV